MHSNKALPCVPALTKFALHKTFEAKHGAGLAVAETRIRPWSKGWWYFDIYSTDITGSPTRFNSATA